MARQFDVVANPEVAEADLRPFLVVLQSDLISGLASTVVAPLIPRERMTGAGRLNPLIVIEGREFWLAMHELFAVDRRVLRKQVTNLETERDAIISALDLLFTGF